MTACLFIRWAFGAAASLALAGCGRSAPVPESLAHDAHEAPKGRDAHGHDDGHEEGHDDGHDDAPDTVVLTDAQIAAARITVAPVRSDLAGAIGASAVIAADPARTTIAAAAVGGRIVSLQRQLGEPVARGDVLAVIESREAAELTAEVSAARGRLQQATTTLEREERLFRERVSAEQDVIAARTDAQAARIRLQLAQDRLNAAGGVAASNRLTVRAPIDGVVIERHAALGAVVAADDALFRVADLSTVALELALSPDDASAVRPGVAVTVTAGGEAGEARIAFVAPIIDAATRQVRALAALPNPQGNWRIGQAVTARIARAGADAGIAVPRAAVQTVEDQPSVFVRTDAGFAVKHLVLGATDGDHVRVRSGLDGDERIAVDNSYVLKAELGKGEGGDHDH